MPSIEYAKKNQQDMLLNDTFIQQLEQGAKKNGIYQYVEKNLVYPPKGAITIPKQYNESFQPFEQIVAAAQLANPNFNIYDIDPKYRYPIYDPLGYPPADVDASPTNFINNVTGFKQAIHADPSTTWLECVDGVFLNDDDLSPAPTDTEIFRKLIEKSPSGRTIVQHGERDFVLIANGSALGIQNTTWNGKQGFQKPPTKQLVFKGKDKGLIQTERGLTFFRPTSSGHMIPQVGVYKKRTDKGVGRAHPVFLHRTTPSRPTRCSSSSWARSKRRTCTTSWLDLLIRSDAMPAIH